MAFKIKDEHWETILSFMELHKDFAAGRISGPNGREKGKRLWMELATRLNSLGYGERTPDKWQKTWTDLKYLIKKKGATLKKDRNITGGGAPEGTPFNEYELRVIGILGSSFYEGIGESEVASTSATRELEKVPHTSSPPSATVEIASTSTTKSIPTVSYRHPGKKRSLDFLNTPASDHDYSFTSRKKQKTNSIEDSYIETIQILKDIKNVIDNRLGEIVTSIKDLTNAISSSK